MALEERLVNGYVLDGYDALARRKINDPVDQQKWVAVRQNPLDFIDVQCSRRSLRRFGFRVSSVSHSRNRTAPRLYCTAPSGPTDGQQGDADRQATGPLCKGRHNRTQ